MTKAFKPATSEQKKRIVQLASSASQQVLKELALDYASAQKLIENGGELKSLLDEAMVSAARDLSTNKRFASEKVRSTRIYPAGYNPRKISLAERIERLSELVSGIGSVKANRMAEKPLPKGAEAWFAIPRWEIFGKTYGEAVKKVFKISAKARACAFSDCCCQDSYEPFLRQHPRSVEMWAELYKQQKSDLIVVPAQFGLRHRGRSVRRVREIFLANEFGLGIFATGIMLLTDPERLQGYTDLWINCAGDEYKPFFRRVWCHAPGWRFYRGTVQLCTGLDHEPHIFYGSATAFLPK
jgi:hypothetical protein